MKKKNRDLTFTTHEYGGHDHDPVTIAPDDTLVFDINGTPALRFTRPSKNEIHMEILAPLIALDLSDSLRRKIAMEVVSGQ